MRALDQCVEAELLGPHDEVDVVCEPGAHVVASGMLATHDQAEFHSWLPIGSPETLSSVRRGCKLGRAARKEG
jgi:hypothetical protein